MVLFDRENDMEETMPQTVPSAGFTPPCDYSAFADSFDLSLLPGGDPFSSHAPPFDRPAGKPKTNNSFYSSLSEDELDLCPDFHTLLVPGEDSPKGSYPSIYLDVASPGAYPLAALSPASQGLLSPFGGYRLSGEVSFYPSSPEESVYSTSPCAEEYSYVKKEGYSSDSSSSSPLPNFTSFGIKEEVSFADSPESDVLTADKRIKQEESDPYRDSRCLRQLLESGHNSPIGGHNPPFSPGHNSPNEGRNSPPEDHKLLRQALNDTSFQKRFNLRPIDLGFLDVGEVKMEEGERSDAKAASEAEEYLLRGCEEGIVQENIAPVLNLAIEQMREDVDSTCAILGISTDPSQWNSASVLSWIRWTSRQFGLPEPAAEQWDMPGPTLVALSEEDFTRRAPQGGMILHAQLEIWKAAYSDEDLRMQWRPETTSSNASSGDISEDEEEEPVPATPDQPAPTLAKPSTSRSSTHIHLWQFLKELLASPQAHGSCIRWLDRANGIFKIEDSVKVAKLWGKRKNRPAMNYDKLSRSIRQYYKKGIMKKTERSQRLVYQFCHPYNL